MTTIIKQHKPFEIIFDAYLGTKVENEPIRHRNIAITVLAMSVNNAFDIVQNRLQCLLGDDT